MPSHEVVKLKLFNHLPLEGQNQTQQSFNSRVRELLLVRPLYSDQEFYEIPRKIITSFCCALLSFGHYSCRFVLGYNLFCTQYLYDWKYLFDKMVTDLINWLFDLDINIGDIFIWFLSRLIMWLLWPVVAAGSGWT